VAWGLVLKLAKALQLIISSFSTDNPKKVFFNAYVYGWGDNKSELSVEFQEDDNLDGTYQPAEEGTYNYRMKIDWLGWKLVSFTYDETKYFNLRRIWKYR
jgi:hypothetical protein